MPTNDRHPLYGEFEADWRVMNDTYRGERHVKLGGTRYLPPTAGMLLDGMNGGRPGNMAFQAYLSRAVFPDYVSDAVEIAIGMMHHKSATIELPPALEPMREVATANGEGLSTLLRRVNEQQLVTGRVGLLLDIPERPAPGPVLPHIALYTAPAIINWDAGASDQLARRHLNLVVLDESENERHDDFTWQWVVKHRVLVLGEVLTNEGPDAGAVYRAGVVRGAETEFSESDLIEPSIRGQRLTRIPFEFINSKDLVPEADDPPLIGLARLSLAIFRGEADYRQSLFMQGQDTLVITGRNADEPVRVGTGVTIEVPIGGDAKYIGLSSGGLAEQRQSLMADRAMAAEKSGRVISTSQQGAESGEALKTRLAAQTATLNQIAITGAQGLQNILRTAAEWVGANPEEVFVEPNLEFAQQGFDGELLVKLMSAKALGAPLSRRSIHEMMQRHGMTSLDLEEEMDEIENEGGGLAGPPGMVEDDEVG